MMPQNQNNNNAGQFVGQWGGNQPQFQQRQVNNNTFQTQQQIQSGVNAAGTTPQLQVASMMPQQIIQGASSAGGGNAVLSAQQQQLYLNALQEAQRPRAGAPANVTVNQQLQQNQQGVTVNQQLQQNQQIQQAGGATNQGGSVNNIQNRSQQGGGPAPGMQQQVGTGGQQQNLIGQMNVRGVQGGGNAALGSQAQQLVQQQNLIAHLTRQLQQQRQWAQELPQQAIVNAAVSQPQQAVQLQLAPGTQMQINPTLTVQQTTGMHQQTAQQLLLQRQQQQRQQQQQQQRQLQQQQGQAQVNLQAGGNNRVLIAQQPAPSNQRGANGNQLSASAPAPNNVSITSPSPAQRGGQGMSAPSNQALMDAMRRATPSVSNSAVQQRPGSTGTNNPQSIPSQAVMDAMREATSTASGAQLGTATANNTNMSQANQFLVSQILRQQQQMMGGSNAPAGGIAQNTVTIAGQGGQQQVQVSNNVVNVNNQANAAAAAAARSNGGISPSEEHEYNRLLQMGVLEPTPIAEGVHNYSANAMQVVSDAKEDSSLLEGFFAGGWQSNADFPDRRRINFHIMKIVARMRPDANRMSHNRLPLMSKKLEEHLYRGAHTKDEYNNTNSLKRRLHLFAKELGKSGGGLLQEGTSTVVDGSGGQVRASDLSSSSDSGQQPALQQQVPQQMQQQPVNLFSRQASNLTPEKKKQILYQQQRRLLLLRHASKCNGGPSCHTRFCPQMVILWKHIKTCRDNTCQVSHCLSSRCALNHYRICKYEGRTATCVICGPVMRHIRSNGDGGSSVGMSTSGLVQGNDELDSLELNDPIDAAQVGNLVSDGMEELLTIEPLDAFTMEERAMQIDNAASSTQAIGLPQAQGQLQNGIAPQAQAAANGMPQVDGLEQKQLVLQQVQQQKETLIGQSHKLQHLLMSASNPEQAAQLQKQQSILRQLNQQFDQQQSILQNSVDNEIHRQGIPPTAASAGTLKRSPEAMDESRPQKMPKVHLDDAPPSIHEIDGGPKRGKLRQSETGSVSSNQSTTADKGTSLIPTMSVSEIEEHLNSLVSTSHLTPRYISRKCLPLVKKLINHEHGWVFKDAVDPVELNIPDYFNIVKHPMDLTLVSKKLGDGAYHDVASFESDTKLVFENAILFNGEDSQMAGIAKGMMEIFTADLQNAWKGTNIGKEPPKGGKNACALCGNHRRLFDPPSLFCSGQCGMQKIRRNAIYYTDRFKQNHWCEKCYDRLKMEEPIQLDDGRETKKSMLLKLTNDSVPEESWVQCDKCQEWNHQICALFNRSQNSKSTCFTCPKCYIKEKGDATPDGDTPQAGSKTVKGADELPHCSLSRVIEEGLEKTLSKAYEKVAADRGCTLSQVEKADGLSVRVVSSLEKKHKVRKEMVARYSKKGYPSEFPVTTKCIVLFQKIHGIDVLLFGMYVYEYGDECPGPNRRRVYISYLDSVRYLEPASYRTIIYQTVIMEYLRFVKLRGFHTAHIWSCPPSRGDEYIFHCHPSHQLTPNDDLLCSWYVEMLMKAKDKGIVLETRTIYDEYLKDNAVNPKTGEAYDPTSLPYFDGDYIPGEIEKIIEDLNHDDAIREETKLKGPADSPGQKNEKKQETGKRRGTRSNPGELVNQARDKVMNRLDLVLVRMNKNFMVAQLLSDEFIQAVDEGEDVSSWTEGNGTKSKRKGKNPNLLQPSGDDKSSDGDESVEESLDNSATSDSWKIVGDTKDHDPLVEEECLATRLQFLNYCQRNNYQFDELRRAKHTSTMLLAYLHNSGARAEQAQQMKAHIQVIAHSSSCSGPPGCLSSNCQRMKQLFTHIKTCDVTYKRGCRICTRLFMLLTKHSRDCMEEPCPIPYCDRIKERTRLLLMRQQMMDDRRRDAQNERFQQEKVE